MAISESPQRFDGREVHDVPEEYCNGLFTLECVGYYFTNQGYFPIQTNEDKKLIGGYLEQADTFSVGATVKVRSALSANWNIDVRTILSEDRGTYLLFTPRSVYRLTRTGDRKPDMQKRESVPEESRSILSRLRKIFLEDW